MNVIINGALGHMGRILADKISETPDMEVFALVDPGFESLGIGDSDTPVPDSHSTPVYGSLSDVPDGGDIVIDFSSAAATEGLLNYGQETGIPLLIATTGQTEEQKALIEGAAKSIPVFYSGNMSLGVALLADLVRQAVATFPDGDVEIIETHHTRKVDAPSGTALMLAEAAKQANPDLSINVGRSGESKREANEIGISSVRRGNIVGIHEVVISTQTQSITLKHEAHDRGLFADGAISAARFLVNQGPGLYDMKSVI